MTEPRFERHQLGEVLQKAAELQEGRGARDADKLSLLGLKQLSEMGTSRPAEPKRRMALLQSAIAAMVDRIRSRRSAE